MKDKKKALLFLPYLAPYRIDLLNELKNYYDLTVIFLFDNAPEQNFNQEILRKKLRVNFEIFERGFNIGVRPIRFGVVNLIIKHKPNIIFSNEYGITSLLISFYCKLSVFNFTHIATTSDNIEILKNVKWFRKISRKLVLHTTIGIIVYTKEVGDWYKTKFPKLVIRICPNIQNPTSILLNEKQCQKLKKKLIDNNSLTDKKNILYVGRLHPSKGLDILFEVLKDFKESSYRLILVGQGPDYNFLKDLSIKLGIEKKVIFAGRFEDEELMSWYKLADFLILPSVFEPFGAVVNEALINGCPVLCSKYCGAKIFIKNGVNGFVFNPKNKKEYLDLLTKMFHKSKEIKSNYNLMNYSFKNSVAQYCFD